MLVALLKFTPLAELQAALAVAACSCTDLLSQVAASSFTKIYAEVKLVALLILAPRGALASPRVWAGGQRQRKSALGVYTRAMHVRAHSFGGRVCTFLCASIQALRTAGARLRQ